MATKEHPSDDFCFLNPPEFLGLTNLRIETCAHPNGELFKFVGLTWHDKDYWFLPRDIKKDRLDCGLVHLYLKGGARLYGSRLIFQPSCKEFYISPPVFKRQPKRRLLVIYDISEAYCVDINFLIDEDRRLWTRKYTMGKDDLIKIPRPKSGHIV